MRQWEYKTIKVDGWHNNIAPSELDKLLNEAGQQGWELITTVGTTRQPGATYYVLFTFKRQVPNPEVE